MAFNDNREVPADGWVQLTANDVAALTVQANGYALLLKGAVGAVAPVDSKAAFRLLPGEPARIVLADTWPGLVGVNRLYAKSESGVGMSVPVSHD